MDTLLTGLIPVFCQNLLHTASGDTQTDMAAGQTGVINASALCHIHNASASRFCSFSGAALHISAENPLNRPGFSVKGIFSHKWQFDLQPVAGAKFNDLLSLPGDL